MHFSWRHSNCRCVVLAKGLCIITGQGKLIEGSVYFSPLPNATQEVQKIWSFSYSSIENGEVNSVLDSQLFYLCVLLMMRIYSTAFEGA